MCLLRLKSSRGNDACVTSTIAHGHLAIAVAAARLLDRLKQWLVQLVRGDLLKLGEHFVAHAGVIGLNFLSAMAQMLS